MPSFELPEENQDSISSPEQAIFQQKLEGLLATGSSLVEIAEILGAESFLTREVRKGKEGFHFDVRGFVENQFRDNISPVELPERFLKLPDTIIPSGEGGELHVGSGKGMETVNSIPRTREFIRLLTEIQEPYILISGTNTEHMMRRETYRIFLLPNKEKLVFINDEEGNATFVVHNASSSSWREYASMTKEQLRNLPSDEVEVIKYLGSLEEWRVQVQEILEKTVAGNYKKPSEIKPLEKAPEGWATKNKIAREKNVSPQLVAKIADSFREAHPEWFQRYLHNEGGGAFEFYHSALVAKVIEKIDGRPDQAPEGWMHVRGLTIELKTPAPTILKIVKKYREGHPEWFGEYGDIWLRPTEFFHPDLVAKVREEFLKGPEVVPEGWMTNNAIAKETESTSDTISKVANGYREANPHWFRRFRRSGREIEQAYEFFHPDLVKKIKEEIAAHPETAPEGWITINLLHKELKRSHPLISKIANKYREAHPEWFQRYVGRAGKPAEFLHPNLADKIREEITARPEVAPEGWMTNSTLASQLRVAFSSVSRIADRYRETHPEWFQKYLDKARKISEFFHPDLVAKIREEITARPEAAPEGWATINELPQTLNVSRFILGKMVKPFRSSNPDWFQMYIDKGRKASEFLHPDLISKIREEIGKTKIEQ